MISAYYDIILENPYGEVVKHLSFPSRTFVRNFMKLLQGLFSVRGGTSLDTMDVVTFADDVVKEDGSTVDVWTEWYAGDIYYYGGGSSMGVNAPEGDDSYGIIVGKGTKDFSYDDYSLDAKISHGTGADQLNYGAMTVNPPYVDTARTPPVGVVKLVRPFINQSGYDVTVAEVGLVARSYWKDENAVRQDEKYLIIRDVLSEAVTVKPNTSLTVSYLFTVE